MEKNQPVFFKKIPATENTKPNAIYLNGKGNLNGEDICEITWRSEKWLVKQSEVLSIQQGLQKRAKQLDAELNKHNKPGISRYDLARSIGISVGTLKKRLALIQTHLVKSE